MSGGVRPDKPKPDYNGRPPWLVRRRCVKGGGHYEGTGWIRQGNGCGRERVCAECGLFLGRLVT